MSPLGKLNSQQIMHSEKVGEFSQDHDSKHFIGGSINLETYTVPTYIYDTISEKELLKSNNIFSQVGYGNAVYETEEDVKIVVENFNLINEHLGIMDINFKGSADIEDLESFFDGKEFILDSVKQDIGANTTTFTCRTVLFN